MSLAPGVAMSAAPTGAPGECWWHIHHDVLAEVLREPVEAQREYIRREKPEAERETRLRLLRPVRGPLPPAVAPALAEWDRARAGWDRASAGWDRASAEWGRANAEWARANAKWGRASAEWDRARAELARVLRSPEMLALHAAECPGCPWDGTTIFQERGKR